MEEKGWTITFFRWDDGKQVVAKRFRTTKEKDEYLKKIQEKGSGWVDEELETVQVFNDYYYMIPA